MVSKRWTRLGMAMIRCVGRRPGGQSTLRLSMRGVYCSAGGVGVVASRQVLDWPCNTAALLINDSVMSIDSWNTHEFLSELTIALHMRRGTFLVHARFGVLRVIDGTRGVRVKDSIPASTS